MSQYGGRQEGIMDKAKDAVGMGPRSQGVAPGQGQGYNPNVNHPSEETGLGGGYGHHPHGGQLGGGYNTGTATGADAYPQSQPRNEGIVDKAKDAVGLGPRSQGGAPGQGQGYNPNVNYPSEETGFGGGHGHHPHGGQLGGGYNTGTATGADAYPQSQPRNEGIVDKAKDAVGLGPRSQGGAPGQGQGYNPNVNHPSEETGFGGGHGHHPHGGQDQLGGGYNTGTATGGDAYPQRKEGIVDKAKDAVGMGPNSGYDARTQTGNDAYVHGNHPAGMQDRVQGVNEPSLFGGEHGVHAPVGRRDGGLNQGEHVPEQLKGETRTEPGYDASKGYLPGQGGHHQTLGATGLGGLGGHHNTGTDTTGIDGRRGKGFEDTTDPYGSKLGSGTGTGTGYDDTTTGSAAPKKGLVTKIKEKIHH